MYTGLRVFRVESPLSRYNIMIVRDNSIFYLLKADYTPLAITEQLYNPGAKTARRCWYCGPTDAELIRMHRRASERFGPPTLLWLRNLVTAQPVLDCISYWCFVGNTGRYNMWII